MNQYDIASYARVSTEHQAEAQTIASQVAALQARAAADGLPLLPDRQFTDDGYSGATLIRPALEQLRDLIAAGEIKRLYVLSPDRLARKYAYQGDGRDTCKSMPLPISRCGIGAASRSGALLIQFSPALPTRTAHLGPARLALPALR